MTKHQEAQSESARQFHFVPELDKVASKHNERRNVIGQTKITQKRNEPLPSSVPCGLKEEKERYAWRGVSKMFLSTVHVWAGLFVMINDLWLGHRSNK